MTTNKVCGKGKCKFTDEFCMSGDCPYDTDNVANNVAQAKSQDLTEQWKKGELELGKYYIKTIYGGVVEDTHIRTKVGRVWNNYQDDEIIEVLAPVPSYEEWQELNKDIDTITELWKHERSQLNEKIQLIGKLSVQAVDLKNEIKQLKELLKRCRDFINYEVPDHCIDDVLIDKIDEVLK